jgi:hypothetical protein
MSASIPVIPAIEHLTQRHPTAQICDAVEERIRVLDQEAREHTIPPVHRSDAIAWLACVALRPEGGAS